MSFQTNIAAPVNVCLLYLRFKFESSSPLNIDPTIKSSIDGEGRNPPKISAIRLTRITQVLTVHRRDTEEMWAAMSRENGVPRPQLESFFFFLYISKYIVNLLDVRFNFSNIYIYILQVYQTFIQWRILYTHRCS